MKVKVKINFWLSGLTDADNSQLQNGEADFKQEVATFRHALKTACCRLETEDDFTPPDDSDLRFNLKLYHWQSSLNADVGEHVKTSLDALLPESLLTLTGNTSSVFNRPSKSGVINGLDTKYKVIIQGLCKVQTDGSHKCSSPIGISRSSQEYTPFVLFLPSALSTYSYNVNAEYTFING